METLDPAAYAAIARQYGDTLDGVLPAPIGERTDFPKVCAHVARSELAYQALHMRCALPTVPRPNASDPRVTAILDGRAQR